MNTKSLAVHEVYPYLRLRRAAEAIEFYKKAFGAEELFRLVEPGGRVGHAEVKIGATTLMLADEYPEMGIVGPEAIGGTTFAIHLHVDDADAWIERAVAAGAVVTRPAQDAFYGERSGVIRDPFGYSALFK
jgi:PhnB protein